MNIFSSHKILKHLDRIIEWQRRGLSHPITYELDMTNLCDSKCPFCFGFYERDKNKASLSFDEAKKIIKQKINNTTVNTYKIEIKDIRGLKVLRKFLKSLGAKKSKDTWTIEIK